MQVRDLVICYRESVIYTVATVCGQGLSIDPPSVYGLVLEGMENEKRPSFQVLQRSFDELSVGSVDLVKIDVEGAEFLVLEGMRNSLQNRSVKRIMVELHNREDKTRLESIFVPCGYTVEWVDPDHLFATIR